jgi:L-proline amide hydrolase
MRAGDGGGAVTNWTREGTIPFKGFETWYGIVGEGEESGKLPVLTLHGGTGVTHDYLESMADLADGRRVIFYDQLGCGKSATPSNPSMWAVDLYIEEVDAVRQALGLEACHIIGQSWGGMLGMQYALTQPAGLASLVVADSPASMRLWVSEANRLREDLPPDAQAALTKHEAAGTYTDPEYLAAVQVFYERHVCRLVPPPEYVARSFANLDANPEVYHTMNGPSEFTVIGTLRDWDITDRLGEIRVPTLVVSGRYDEATPEIAGRVHRGIPSSEWIIFEQSSHLPHAEERELFMERVGAFLATVEAARVSQA